MEYEQTGTDMEYSHTHYDHIFHPIGQRSLSTLTIKN